MLISLDFCSEEVWKTFPRQEEAIKFMRMHDNVRVFSYEDRVKGQRRFLVSSYHEFWRRQVFAVFVYLVRLLVILLVTFSNFISIIYMVHSYVGIEI